MNARKLPSGRWQSKVYIGTVDGKKQFVTVTEDTRKECLLKAAAAYEAHKAVQDNKITVSQAVDRYIDSRRGVLSPASIAGYVNQKKRYITSYPISSCLIRDLTDEKLQQWVSDLAQKVSKKTIKNVYGLLHPAIKMFRRDCSFIIEFPKERPFKSRVPTSEEVTMLLKAAKETKPNLYRACLLAAFSTLRRGEIVCLTRDDITGNILHVSKDMVQDENGQWVTKKLPKEEASVRDIPLPQWIVDEMPEGRLVNYTPQGITREFIATLDKLNIPHFRFHDLRKFSVSMMHHKGVSMASIQKLGGWSNMDTPQKIYISSLADENEKEMKAYLEYAEGMKI